MVEILAVKTAPPERELPSTFEAVRAEALFASTLQSSGSPSPDQVRRAVATTLRRLGSRGCAAQTAGEFGDHPDTAVARMSWALTTIRTVYPTPSTTPTHTLRPLAGSRELTVVTG
jgi:hypothetical protein